MKKTVKKSTKKDLVEAPKVALRVPERDANGRFKKREASTKTVAVPKQETIKSKNLHSLFNRRVYPIVPKSGAPIYLKIINPTVRGPSYPLYTRTLSETEVMLTAAEDYGNYMYLVYTNTAGVHNSGYFLHDYEFGLIQKNDEGYNKLAETFEAIKLKNIYRYLGHDFTIGSDPEIFVEKKEGGLIPAYLFLPGKDKPAKTANNRNYFSTHGGCPMYWDGFQAEFTTQANRCLGHHGDSIAAGMRGVYDAAKAKFPGAKLSIQSVFHIDPEILETADEEHVAFGCMPSFNVYGLKVRMPPPREVPFRSAGGHIHFGIGKTSAKKHAEAMVKALDAILGVACVSLFAEFDNPARRRLYGLPGEYRLPPHGLEYRPLSNAWLCHPTIMNLVIDLSRKCVVFGREGWMKHWKADEKETIDCIIQCDVKAAHAILERNKDMFKQLLKASYQNSSDQEINMLYEVFIKGIRSVIKNPEDFVGNWRLNSGWRPHSTGHLEPNVRNLIYNRNSNPKYKA